MTGDVTRNIIPAYADVETGYLTSRDSVADEGWGYSRGVSLEYSSFADPQFPMSTEIWAKLNDPIVGLSNFDNMFKFAREVSNGR
jgi:hypothetical protein